MFIVSKLVDHDISVLVERTFKVDANPNTHTNWLVGSNWSTLLETILEKHSVHFVKQATGEMLAWIDSDYAIVAATAAHVVCCTWLHLKGVKID